MEHYSYMLSLTSFSEPTHRKGRKLTRKQVEAWYKKPMYIRQHLNPVMVDFMKQAGATAEQIERIELVAQDIAIEQHKWNEEMLKCMSFAREVQGALAPIRTHKQLAAKMPDLFDDFCESTGKRDVSGTAPAIVGDQKHVLTVFNDWKAEYAARCQSA